VSDSQILGNEHLGLNPLWLHRLAPPEVLNVRHGQPVELNIARRLDEEYVAPPPGPFAGSGHRLGSPVPATVPSSSSSTERPAASATPVAQAPSPAPPASFEVDMTAPTTSIQIRLADGTRLVSRMNLTHTVGDIRRFINA
jgi:UBX domain-containing protein 1